MRIEDLKGWQWVIVGIFVGLLFGAVRMYQGPWFDDQGIETIGQSQFERGLMGQPANEARAWLFERYIQNQSLLKNIVIHPRAEGDSQGAYWVTGKICLIRTVPNKEDPQHNAIEELWTPFKYPAPAPFTAQSNAPGNYSNVMEYLKTLHQQPDAHFSFAYAWWEQPQAMLGMSAAAGFLIIGIAWPLSLGLMLRAGIAKPREKKVSLSKVRSSDAPKKAAVDHSAGDRQLDSLNAEMESNLAGVAGSGGAAGAAEAGAGSVKALAGTAADAPVVAKTQEELDKEYGGEFYPVVRAVHKHTDEKKA